MITKKSGNLILVRMVDGENLFDNLEKIAKQYKIKSGIILCALGMLKDVELAYFNYPKTGKYLTKEFEGPFEITNLSGNLSYFEDKLIFHVHVVLGNDEFDCIGGHLNKAKVNATLEMFILIANEKFVRRFDEKTGLKLLNFE